MPISNEKLEAARMQKRWSIAVASEKVGVSVNTFNRWERGLQIPQLGTLDQLCNAFGLSPEELGFGRAAVVKRRGKIGKSDQLCSSQQALPTSSSSIPSTIGPNFTHLSTASLHPSITPVPIVRVTQYQQGEAFRECLEQAKRSLESMNLSWHTKESGIGVSRRQAIATLISTPAAVFGLTQTASTRLLHPEEILALNTVNVPLMWRLYFEGGLAEVGRILPGYLAQLSELVKTPSPYQQRAAVLASQAYQLASLLTLQYQNYGTALTYARQAFDYGALVQDAHLQVASLIRQAQVYFYLQHPWHRLHTYEQAIQYENKISPLLQGRLYIGLTEAHSDLGQPYEAQRLLDLAHYTFPTRYEEDPNFSYTHFNHWSLTGLEGLMYLNLSQPGRAWDAFTQVDETIPEEPVPNRVELLVRQAHAAVALNDLEQSCTYLQRAVEWAAAAGNQLRHDEAYRIYERMRTKWGKESGVKALEGLFT